MTSSSKSLVDHVLDLIARGVEGDERPETLALRGPLPSAEVQALWLEIAAKVPAPMVSLQVYDPAISGDVDPRDPFDPDREVVITIEKPAVEGVALFFFQSSLAAYLPERTLRPRIAIADLRPVEAFNTRGLEVVPWNLPDTPNAVTQPPNRIDPTPYVRDFVPLREVPTDLGPWLLVTPAANPSDAFDLWGAIAARRLLASLVSRASLDEAQVWLQASGPPAFRIQADDPAVATAREELHEAAHWVFLSGSDVEARHLIFAAELARAHRVGQSMAQTVEHALEAARLTYEAHVQSSSRETLKTLADLRKTVIDETQKVAQRAQDMTATLWRDLAVSAAPFVLKVLGDATKVTGPIVSAIFYFAAAAFIVLSFGLQWRINAAYFRSQEASRMRWMQTLYSYISAREREEIAVAPIEEAMRNYRETRSVLMVVYGVLVCGLIYFGAVVLNQRPSPAAPASPPKTEQPPTAPPPAQTPQSPPPVKSNEPPRPTAPIPAPAAPPTSAPSAPLTKTEQPPQPVPSPSPTSAPAR